MTTTDTDTFAKLREAAEAEYTANDRLGVSQDVLGDALFHYGHNDDTCAFARQANPATILALLAALDASKERAALALSDASRRLRKEDVEGICLSADACFQYSDHVRCGPCAVNASAAQGVVIDDTVSHLPEVCGLRHEAKALTEERDRLAAENERLRSALEWYANPETYKPLPNGLGFVKRDFGACARATLERK